MSLRQTETRIHEEIARERELRELTTLQDLEEREALSKVGEYIRLGVMLERVRAIHLRRQFEKSEPEASPVQAVADELAEFREAAAGTTFEQSEYGDLLLAVLTLGVDGHFGIEAALGRAIDRRVRRLDYIYDNAQARPGTDLYTAEARKLWDEAKREERGGRLRTPEHPCQWVSQSASAGWMLWRCSACGEERTNKGGPSESAPEPRECPRYGG